MPHFAKLNSDNIVELVLVGSQKDDGKEAELSARTGDVYKQTSYNTLGGVYYDPETREPAADQSKAFRKNFASVGFTYDANRDAFIPPKPHASWVLNETTCLWQSPVEKPDDDFESEPNVIHYWNEANTNWETLPEKQYESWRFDFSTWEWKAPVPLPRDSGTGDPPQEYTWDEANTVWVAV